MKKIFILFAASLLVLAGCTRNQEIVIPDSNLSLFARTESPGETKTVVESGTHVFWEPGDEIAVFMGEKTAKFTTDITAASGTATFKGTFGDSSWPEDLDLWAVYPFSEDATFDGETITTTLPSEQIAREGSFGKDMNLSVAHSNTSTLQFYNVGGGLRFSVTEEGIKKVMFEGLSGEIISGKVKIGFENGSPVVKEVTSGSQFITLLPPSGKEAFVKDTWYYIVAIPGALEGGYKLRFYKDSDYARRVSEKAVEIKRSIYGNLERADQGIEYEATTTHYPESDQEWEKSFSSTNMIVKDWDTMVSKSISLENSLSVDPANLASQITNIEGVSGVEIKGSTIVITQSDGIILNLLLDAYNCKNYIGDEEDISYYSPIKSISASNRFKASKITSPPTGGSVLVLSPAAFDSPILPEKLSEYEEIFKEIGFQNVNIDPVASIGMFYGNKLAEYDVVIFSTHGGIGTFNTVDGKGITSTIICTGTPYDESNKEVYMKRNPALAVVPKNFGQQIKQAINDNVTYIGEVESITYLCMTPYFLDELDENAFNNCWIHFESCHTADFDSSGKRPMMQAFVDKGVSLVTGFYDSVSWPGVMYPMTYQLIKDMSLGLSFDDAYNRRNAVFRDCCSGYEIGDPFFLVNPYPINLHNSEIRDFRTTLIWDQAKTRGDYRFKVYLKWPNSDSYSTYDSTNSKAYTTDVLQPGDYSWYVEANLYYDGKVIQTFTSDTKSFTVEDAPSPEELLVSRTYDGKTYSIIRKNVSSTDCRINGDGSKFYTCSYSVKVGNESYDLPGSFYSYTDRNFRDTGPVMAVNTQTGKTYVFLIEKDTDETYGMCGYVFTLSSGSISQQTVFTYANFGWFPYFEWYEGQFLLNMFSYAGYFSIIAPQDEDWVLYYNEDIYPDDFLVLQQRHDLICIH